MTNSRSGVFVVSVLVTLTWLLLALFTIPRAISRDVGDYGFFTGIAERLRAGDVLYVQVWDNKDPLVFYALAMARTLGQSTFASATVRAAEFSTPGPGKGSSDGPWSSSLGSAAYVLRSWPTSCSFAVAAAVMLVIGDAQAS